MDKITQKLRRIKDENPALLAKIILDLPPDEQKMLLYDWSLWGRDKQLAPEGKWRVWVASGGRSSGKSRTGSEFIIQRAKEGKGPIALIGQTSADVRDVMIELGPSSIMQVCPPDFKPLYEPSKRRLTFPNGVTCTTFSGDEPGQLRGPQHQCFIAGTNISTPHNSKTIEKMVVGEEVITRGGICKVEAVRNYEANTGRVCFSNGEELVGTYNHPVWSLDREAWVFLNELKLGEKICTGDYLQTATSVLTKIIGKYINTDMYGKNIMGPSQRGIRYTILMVISKIMKSRILRRYLQRSINKSTPNKNSLLNVLIAELNLKPGDIKELADVGSVDKSTMTKSGKLFEFAITAEKRFYLDLEPTVASVVSTWEDVGQNTVYSLQISNHKEYIANNIVVHNTVWVDELPKFDDPQESFDQMNFGLRIGDSRCLITTTPTPHDIMKSLYLQWQADPTGKVRYTVMPTKDNAANIDPEFLKDIEDRYGNTRLYRQEVLGEIIWESEDALFTSELLDEFRIAKEDLPELVQIVVSVDPAVTNKKQSDTTGITVCGIDAEGHGYVLYTLAIKASPNTWAQKVLDIYDSFEASYVVVEVNNGGDLLRSTLEQARSNIPIKEVRASQSKIARMEPISLLAEQGKVHLVGVHEELEDQLVVYNGKGPSPDLYDSMCWGLTQLMLNKRASVTVSSYNI